MTFKHWLTPGEIKQHFTVFSIVFDHVKLWIFEGYFLGTFQDIFSETNFLGLNLDFKYTVGFWSSWFFGVWKFGATIIKRWESENEHKFIDNYVGEHSFVTIFSQKLHMFRQSPVKSPDIKTL